MVDQLTTLKEAVTALRNKRELYEANTSAVRPSEDVLRKLDSSMKRNTALLRKLKQLSEDSKQSILLDVTKTNQSKVCYPSHRHRRRQ
jgi:regulator of nonsense transcripts 2